GDPRSDPRRAARIYTHPGRAGAWDQPLHLHPARVAVRRDGRDGLGNTAGSGRRDRTPPRRGSARSARGTNAPAPTRPKASPPGRCARADPRRTRTRSELRRDCTRTERGRRSNLASGPAVVVVNGACRSDPLAFRLRRLTKVEVDQARASVLDPQVSV